ncbi:MAG: PRC-barrel domain-containing protein [Rhizobiaceae bacterium]
MKKVLIALGVTTLLAGPAMAQTATSTDTTTTTAPATTTDTFVTAQPTDMLSSNLIGLDIANGQKEDVGEIKDLVVSDGKLAGYVVSVDGFLGVGERYVVIAPSAIQINYSENDKEWTAAMDATKDQLKSAPEFKYEGRWAK